MHGPDRSSSRACTVPSLMTILQGRIDLRLSPESKSRKAAGTAFQDSVFRVLLKGFRATAVESHCCIRRLQRRAGPFYGMPGSFHGFAGSFYGAGRRDPRHSGLSTAVHSDRFWHGRADRSTGLPNPGDSFLAWPGGLIYADLALPRLAMTRTGSRSPSTIDRS